MHTDVTGKAARTGHRLTIGFTDWTATVDYTADQPSHVRVQVATGSLQVKSGEGGLTPLTAPERTVARANAVKVLKAEKFPQIVFDASEVVADGDGYRLTGRLEICGKTRPHILSVAPTGAGAARTVAGQTVVSHADFGLKPFGMMMGALRVADEATVRLQIAVPE